MMPINQEQVEKLCKKFDELMKKYDTLYNTFYTQKVRRKENERKLIGILARRVNATMKNITTINRAVKYFNQIEKGKLIPILTHDQHSKLFTWLNHEMRMPRLKKIDLISNSQSKTIERV